MSQSKKPQLLVIDDEQQIRRFIRLALASHGYDVLEAGTAAEAIAWVEQESPDAVILDLGLPDQDGLMVLHRLRELYDGPIIVLSVRDDEESIVSALDSGAHDYIRKPFLLGELVARLRLAMRSRQVAQVAPFYSSCGLVVDLANRKVTMDGRDIRLTVTEYELLKCLIKHRGKVMTHNQILAEVWGPKSVEHIQYLRVYIGHLRQKLETDANKPRLIVTEPGVGYRMQNFEAKVGEALTSESLPSLSGDDDVHNLC